LLFKPGGVESRSVARHQLRVQLELMLSCPWFKTLQFSRFGKPYLL